MLPLLHRYVVNDMGGVGKTVYQFPQGNDVMPVPEITTIVVPQEKADEIDISSNFLETARVG